MASQGVILQVKVTPKAKQNKIGSVVDGWLKIYVTAAPEKGQANQAVVDLLAKEWKLPKSRIVLMSGATSRQKVFLLEGLTSLPREIGFD